jgi:hypothetical protein
MRTIPPLPDDAWLFTLIGSPIIFDMLVIVFWHAKNRTPLSTRPSMRPALLFLLAVGLENIARDIEYQRLLRRVHVTDLQHEFVLCKRFLFLRHQRLGCKEHAERDKDTAWPQ